MSSLAQWLLAKGYQVRGSDRQRNQITDLLVQKGAIIYEGHSAHNIGDAQLVVRTSAVNVDNEEVACAIDKNIPVVLREELLGAIFNSYSTRIAICGTHGKTTVTAMVHHVLQQCGIAHTSFIGGLYQGNNFCDGGEIVIAEACEYNRSFLHLVPTICCCLNVEYDHPDCFSDEKQVMQAFGQFACTATDKIVLPEKLSNLVDTNNVVLFDKQFVVTNVKQLNTGTNCQVNQVSMSFPLVGNHNICNVQATIAVCVQLGLSLKDIAKSLANFIGVERRWSVYGPARNIVLDYAHHPTEIKCAIQSALSLCKGKVYCLFQPHTFSRTKAFWKDFACCFRGVEHVGYLPIFPAREKAISGIDSGLLTEYANSIGVSASYVSTFEGAVDFARKNVTHQDLLLILGAGDICNLIEMM